MSAWRNRIVGMREVDPAELMANPDNFRIHSRLQQDALSESLETLGWLIPVYVQQGTDVVVDGHLRVTLALRAREADPAVTVPVIDLDLSDAEVKDALARVDTITQLAGTDHEKLAALLNDLHTNAPHFDKLREQVSQLRARAAATGFLQPLLDEDDEDEDDPDALPPDDLVLLPRSETDDGLVTLHFNMTAEDRATVMNAINRAKGGTGVTSAAALVAICHDYLARPA